MKTTHSPFSCDRLLTQVLSGLAGVVGIMGLLMIAQPGIAQTINGNSSSLLEAPQSGDQSGNFSSDSVEGSLSSMFELFHRLNMGPMRSSSDFRRSQQETIGTEAANFRQQQLNLLQQQQQSPSTTPTLQSPQPNPQP